MLELSRLPQAGNPVKVWGGFWKKRESDADASQLMLAYLIYSAGGKPNTHNYLRAPPAGPIVVRISAQSMYIVRTIISLHLNCL
jgi:hypothetical protein